MRHIIVILFLMWSALAQAQPLQWAVLENCRLIHNSYNDGDSFHVMHDGKKYIFRLYYVDAPETELYLRPRIQEQAEAFGISFDKMLEIGHAATAFVNEQLSDTFTVYTKWHSAQGRSASLRYYAFIRTGDRDLGEMLVERGLARVFGVRVNTPDGTAASGYRSHLLEIQQQARENQAGAWLYAKALDEYDGDNPFAQLKAVICPRALPVYSPGTPRQYIGSVARRTVVYVLEEFPDGWVHIRYREEPGDITDAYCLRWDLKLPDLPTATP
jgi:endonuclease YncB( thermonuclease family)